MTGLTLRREGKSLEVRVLCPSCGTQWTAWMCDNAGAIGQMILEFERHAVAEHAAE